MPSSPLPPPTQSRGTSSADCSQGSHFLTISTGSDTELLINVVPTNALSLCRKEVKAAALFLLRSTKQECSVPWYSCVLPHEETEACEMTPGTMLGYTPDLHSPLI